MWSVGPRKRRSGRFGRNKAPPIPGAASAPRMQPVVVRLPAASWAKLGSSHSSRCIRVTHWKGPVRPLHKLLSVQRIPRSTDTIENPASTSLPARQKPPTSVNSTQPLKPTPAAAMNMSKPPSAVAQVCTSKACSAHLPEPHWKGG